MATTFVLTACHQGALSAAARPSAASSHGPVGHLTGPPLQVRSTWKLPPGSTLVLTPTSLWVLGGPSGVLTQVDPSTDRVVRTVRPPHPAGYGTYADGSLWVASLDEDAVMELDARSGKLRRTITSSHGRPFYRPIGVAVTGRNVWVLNHGDETVASSVTRLDARTGASTASIELPGHHAAGPWLAGGRLWVTLTTESTVVQIDPHTGRLVGAPTPVDTGTCLAGSMADGDLWFSGLDDGQGGACHTVARRVDPDTGSVSPVRYGSGKRLVDFARLAGQVWASDIGRTVYRVDLASGRAIPALVLPAPVAGNHMVAGFGSLWVLGGDAGQLTRIDVPAAPG